MMFSVSSQPKFASKMTIPLTDAVRDEMQVKQYFNRDEKLSGKLSETGDLLVVTNHPEGQDFDNLSQVEHLLTQMTARPEDLEAKNKSYFDLAARVQRLALLGSSVKAMATLKNELASNPSLKELQSLVQGINTTTSTVMIAQHLAEIDQAAQAPAKNEPNVVKSFLADLENTLKEGGFSQFYDGLFSL